MKANCKFSSGMIASLVAAVLSVVSFVIYQVNISGAGYFASASVTAMPLVWAAVAALVIAVALGMVKAKGVASRALDLLAGLLQLAAPALLAYCLISLIGGRVEGLGYIYFSNADVAKEVQTAANLSSATWAIISMVACGVSMLAAIVASFFNLRKD